MPRALLLVLVLIVVLAAGCATQHGSSHAAPEPLQVTSHLPSDWTGLANRHIVWVRIAGGAPDAVLLEEPSIWAKAVAQLEYREALVFEGEKQGRYMRVHTRDMGVNVHGWVLRAACSRHLPEKLEDQSTEYETEGAFRAGYFSRTRERELDTDLSPYLAPVDRFEAERARLLGFKAIDRGQVG